MLHLSRTRAALAVANDLDGRRKRAGARTSRVCRVPPQVSATVAMTFAAAPKPRAEGCERR